MKKLVDRDNAPRRVARLTSITRCAVDGNVGLQRGHARLHLIFSPACILRLFASHTSTLQHANLPIPGVVECPKVTVAVISSAAPGAAGRVLREPVSCNAMPRSHYNVAGVKCCHAPVSRASCNRRQYTAVEYNTLKSRTCLFASTYLGCAMR